MRAATWDVPGAVIAGLLVLADVALHISGHDAAVFDSTVPVIAALYLGGRVATTSAHVAGAAGASTTTSENGRITTTTGQATGNPPA